MWGKIMKDLASTLYDDFEYKYMSLPRVWCAISGLCIVVAWIAEQFYGLKFSAWTQLVAWGSACLAAYTVKKYVEKEKQV